MQQRKASLAVVVTLIVGWCHPTSLGAADRQEVMLSSYPLLSQRDPANYRDPTMLFAHDTLPDKSRTETVANLACAATVYAMLERGRGNSRAAIDDFYIDPRRHNGNGPGAIRPDYVQSDVSIDFDAIKTSLYKSPSGNFLSRGNRM